MALDPDKKSPHSEALDSDLVDAARLLLDPALFVNEAVRVFEDEKEIDAWLQDDSQEPQHGVIEEIPQSKEQIEEQKKQQLAKLIASLPILEKQHSSNPLVLSNFYFVTGCACQDLAQKRELFVKALNVLKENLDESNNLRKMIAEHLFPKKKNAEESKNENNDFHSVAEFNICSVCEIEIPKCIEDAIHKIPLKERSKYLSLFNSDLEAEKNYSLGLYYSMVDGLADKEKIIAYQIALKYLIKAINGQHQKAKELYVTVEDSLRQVLEYQYTQQKSQAAEQKSQAGVLPYKLLELYEEMLNAEFQAADEKFSEANKEFNEANKEKNDKEKQQHRNAGQQLLNSGQQFLNAGIAYRLKIACICSEQNHWQRARSIYLDILHLCIKNKTTVPVEVYSCLKELTDNNTLEGKFYALTLQDPQNNEFKKSLDEFIAEVQNNPEYGFLLNYLSHFLTKDERLAPFKSSKDHIEAVIKAKESRLKKNVVLAAKFFNKPVLLTTSPELAYFRIPDYKENKVSGYKTYRGTKLGSGTNGDVYKLVDLAAPEKTEIVAKFTKPCSLSEKEVAFNSRYFYTEPILQVGERHLLLTEYIPGKNLCDSLYSQTAQLSPRERIRLVAQIALALNKLQHDTLSGSALLHADLKLENIMFSLGDEVRGAAQRQKDKANSQEILSSSGSEQRETDVRIIDFGKSVTLDDADEQELLEVDRVPLGTPGSLAPEYFKSKKIGKKTDVYAMTSTFAAALGASDPFNLKDKIMDWKTQNEMAKKHQMPDLSSASYDLTGVLDFEDLPGYLAEVKPFVIQFLNRMQAPEYAQRPDGDEVLRFFTTLDNYSSVCEKLSKVEGVRKAGEETKKTYEETKKDREAEIKKCEEQIKACEKTIKDFGEPIKVCKAKLVLLANGWWYEKFLVPVKEEKEVKNIEITFEQYDFVPRKQLEDELHELKSLELKEEAKKVEDQLQIPEPAALEKAFAIIQFKPETNGIFSFQTPEEIAAAFHSYNAEQRAAAYEDLEFNANNLKKAYGENKYKIVLEVVKKAIQLKLVDYRIKRADKWQGIRLNKADKLQAVEDVINSINDNNLDSLSKNEKEALTQKGSRLGQALEESGLGKILERRKKVYEFTSKGWIKEEDRPNIFGNAKFSPYTLCLFYCDNNHVANMLNSFNKEQRIAIYEELCLKQKDLPENLANRYDYIWQLVVNELVAGVSKYAKERAKSGEAKLYLLLQALPGDLHKKICTSSEKIEAAEEVVKALQKREGNNFANIFSKRATKKGELAKAIKESGLDLLVKKPKGPAPAA